MAGGQGPPIAVLFVDDQTMIAEAFERFLASEPEIEVVAVAGTVATAIEAAESLRPTVVVVKKHLPDGSGEDVARAVTRRFTGTSVVLLTERADRALLQSAFDAGCVGVVETSEPLERLAVAVKEAADGRLALSPASLRRLLEPTADGVPASVLTPREHDVLRRVALGRSNLEVAVELEIELNTVRTHLQSVLRKLGAHSKLEAVARARQNGLLEP